MAAFLLSRGTMKHSVEIMLILTVINVIGIGFVAWAAYPLHHQSNNYATAASVNNLDTDVNALGSQVSQEKTTPAQSATVSKPLNCSGSTFSFGTSGSITLTCEPE